MQVRARVDKGANEVFRQTPGSIVMSQLKYANGMTTDGAMTITASDLLAGIINRTGPTGAYIDTLPTVASLIAACPELSVGDTFTFIIRNTVAFANTIAIGTGWALGSNTAIAASLVREYLVTILSNALPQVFSVTTTNASPTLTNVGDAFFAQLQPGMYITGTGIPALTTIISVNRDAGIIKLSANATATADMISATTSPTATIEGVRSSTL